MTIKRGGQTFTATNANVVPYIPFLLLKFECHINAEKSNGPRNSKYLYKYATKGPDRAMVSVEADGEERPRDEISDFKDLRCGRSSVKMVQPNVFIQVSWRQ